MTPTAPILFYDGACGLCHRAVQWFLRHDRDRRLRFAPLQGSTYAAIDDPTKPTGLDTMVMLDADGLHVRSGAVLSALRAIGGPWGVLAAIGWWVPRPLRNAVYRFVARHRLGWFGVVDACTLPGGAADGRFLP